MNVIQLGHTLVRLDSVDSTNQYAAQWLSRATVAEGTVIIARSQRQGKGQRGNSWLSEEGMNLTFSVILTPTSLPSTKAYLLTHIAAMAVRKAVNSHGPQTLIKWPNDVYCGPNKIAGILVENIIQENKIKHTVIGIGLNVNQSTWPPEMNATSIVLETGRTTQLEALLQEILDQLSKYYQWLLTANYEKLHQEYVEHLYLKNVKKTYLYNGMRLKAAITGIDENGKLVLETKTGTVVADLKEIVFIK